MKNFLRIIIFWCFCSQIICRGFSRSLLLLFFKQKMLYTKIKYLKKMLKNFVDTGYFDYSSIKMRIDIYKRYQLAKTVDSELTFKKWVEGGNIPGFSWLEFKRFYYADRKFCLLRELKRAYLKKLESLKMN